MLKFILLMVLSGFWVSGCSDAEKSERRDVVPAPLSDTRSRLLTDLQSGDVNRIVVALNDAKATPSDGRVLQLLRTVWSLDVATLPGVSLDVMNDPRVRIEVADALMQASNNRDAEVDRAGILEYARSLIASDDAKVSRSAVTVIGFGFDDRDIGLLVDLYLKDDRLWRTAAFSLVTHCGVSEGEIESLSRRAGGERGEFLRNFWSKAGSSRDVWCKRIK